MKAIAICGSPRKNGNTEILLKRCCDKFSEAGFETKLELLAHKTIKACIGCNGCRKTENNKCVLKDDGFNELYKKTIDSDIIITGSPVYFGSASSQITSFLDRAGYVARANGNPLSRKIGAPIVVARRAGQNFTYAQLVCWYTINDMIVPGSTYWNIAFGREKEDVCSDDEGLKTVDRLAENIIWLANKIK